MGSISDVLKDLTGILFDKEDLLVHKDERAIEQRFYQEYPELANDKNVKRLLPIVIGIVVCDRKIAADANAKDVSVD